MSDLISRKALVKAILAVRDRIPRNWKTGEWIRGGLHKALRCVETAAAIDAVEIVRCRDCKHRGLPLDCPMCHDEVYYDDDGYSDWFPVDNTINDGFCYAGERNEEI